MTINQRLLRSLLAHDEVEQAPLTAGALLTVTSAAIFCTEEA
jgi:hypothetical protein